MLEREGLRFFILKIPKTRIFTLPDVKNNLKSSIINKSGILNHDNFLIRPFFALLIFILLKTENTLKIQILSIQTIYFLSTK